MIKPWLPSAAAAILKSIKGIKYLVFKEEGLFMNLFKNLKNNNKGFSLVELVVAIGILAIIITPTLNTFLTSARINRDSRKYMGATDVAQSLIEGFSDKTYDDVKYIVTQLGTSTLSGDYALSPINDNAYNAMAAKSGASSNYTLLETNYIQVSANKVEYSTSDYGGLNAVVHTQTLGQNENVVVNDLLNATEADFRKCAFALYNTDPGKKMITTCQLGTNQEITMIGYSNIEHGGYLYDAAIIFYPCAVKSDDIYFGYYVFTYVYEIGTVGQKGQTGIHDATLNPKLRMSTGIKNYNYN